MSAAGFQRRRRELKKQAEAKEQVKQLKVPAVAEIKAMLDEKGIAYDDKAKKAGAGEEEKAKQEAARRLQAYRGFMKEKQEDEKIAKKRKPKEVTKDDKPGKAKKSDRRK
jgi:hypothetical protein